VVLQTTQRRTSDFPPLLKSEASCGSFGSFPSGDESGGPIFLWCCANKAHKTIWFGFKVNLRRGPRGVRQGSYSRTLGLT